jgi:hypothetical protein
MFQVRRDDINGTFLGSWESFDEANAEYKRQVEKAVGYKDDESFVTLSVVLRQTTIARSQNMNTYKIPQQQG